MMLYMFRDNCDKRLSQASFPLPLTNVVIAAYITAQVRLKLYSYVEKIK